ncbi:TPA: 3-oxoacyl-ACP synthase, partial [bacterium]|nr:3-oxoacyl-ACP synthase [bacterium]
MNDWKRISNIVAIEYYVPENILTNDDLEKIFGHWSAEQIYKNTGVKTRHIANNGICASDLGIEAVNKLFEKNSIDQKFVEMLIFCSQTHDHYLPATSCIIQEKLGLPNSCGAFDMNFGCSGYVYGLA